LVHSMSHLNPFHTFAPYFFNIRFNIILISSPGSPLRFSDRNFEYSFHFPVSALCPAHVLLLYYVIYCLDYNSVEQCFSTGGQLLNFCWSANHVVWVYLF
jgi:hypothetical protein